MREVQRRHDGDAIEAHDLAAVADLAHAAVEELRRIEQRRALVVRAGDHVFLLHDAHADARLVRLAHAPCSRVLSRPIMASTRVRTCSFLCRSEARSPASDSCRCTQRAVLFLADARTRGDQLLDALREAGEFEIELCFCVSLMADDYRAALSAGQCKLDPAYNDAIACISRTTRDIQQLLGDQRSLTDAAEAHGTLAGCLCAAVGYRFEDWLLEILPEGRARSGRRRRPCASCTRRPPARCGGADMEFELLLPEDAQPIDARTTALAAVVPGLSLRAGRRRHTGCRQPARERSGEIVRDLTRDHARRRRCGRERGVQRERLRGAGRVRAGRACSSLFEELEPCAARAAARGRAAALGQQARVQAHTARPAQASMVERRVRAPPPPADAAHGARLHRHPAGRAGAAAQQRRRIRLPPGQRLPLSDRLRRAGGGGGAGSGARAGRVHPVRARARPGARDLGRAARGTRWGGARLRRRRRLPDHRHRRDPARAAWRTARACSTPWACTRSSTSGWSAGSTACAPRRRNGRHPPQEFVALDHVLHDMRLYKSRARARA